MARSRLPDARSATTIAAAGRGRLIREHDSSDERGSPLLARHGSSTVYERTARLPDDAFSPRYWPTWLVVMMLAAVGRLAQPLRLGLGRFAGWVMWISLGARRHIARRNLEHCLPQLDERARARLLRQHFRELGVALVESMAAWSLPAERVAALARVRGGEHLDAAHAEGHGVLLIAGHFLPLNMCMQHASMVVSAHAVYRRHKNPIIDYLEVRGRERQGARLFSHQDMRTPLRALRNGETVWFSPDQDQGLRNGAFVPFFGHPAATVTSVARLARATGARVVMLLYRRLASGGYEIEFLPALADFPGDDLVAATRRINAAIEQQAYVSLSQYLWVHRRFKTRPQGDPSIYD